MAERSDPATQGTAAITFTGFEKAPDEVRDSLEELGVRAEDVEGRDLWYFTFEAELARRELPGWARRLRAVRVRRRRPVDRRGRRGSTLVFSDLPGCPTEDFETADGGATSTISFCRWWLSARTTRSAACGTPRSSSPDYEPLNGGPVTWSVSETPADSIPVE